MVKNREFTLANGYKIWLDAIEQWGTYSGLLEGLPTRRSNTHHINATIDEAKRKWRLDPYLIQPIEYSGRRYPPEVSVSIPGITCIARFASWVEVRNGASCGSHMSIAWFQPDFALPIEASVLEQILAIDWEKHASNYDI